MFSVSFVAQQSIYELFVGCRIGVRNERIDIFDARRQAGQVEE